MSFCRVLLIAAPLLLFAAYIIGSVLKCKWMHVLSRKMLKRMYYLFCLIYFTVVSCIFYPDIIKIQLYEKYGIRQDVYNIICFAAVFWLAVIIWDFLFISCFSINSFVFKDFKVTMEDAEEIKIAEIVDEKNIGIADSVLRTQVMLSLGMGTYVKDVDLDENVMYRNLIKKYANLRKNIDFFLFDKSEAGIKEMQRVCKLDDIRLSSVWYSLSSKHVCTPEDSDMDVIYAIINTKAAGELIIVLKGEYLYKLEHLVIQNLVCLMDLYIENEYKDLLIESLEQA